MGTFAAPRDRKLVVLGLPYDVDNDGLTEYMSKFGELCDVIVMKDRATGRSRGFGYVTFASVEDAQKVAAIQHVLNGKRLEVKVATPKEEIRSSSIKNVSRIFVARIPQTVTDELFRSYFAKYGVITDAYMPKEHGSKLHRGIGFVTFEDSGSVDNLMNETHELGGAMVAVDRAAPRDDPLKVWGKALSEGYLSMYNAYLNAMAQFGASGTAPSGSYNASGSEFSDVLVPSSAGGTGVSGPGESGCGAGVSWAKNDSSVCSDVPCNSLAMKSGNAETSNNFWGINDGSTVGTTQSAAFATSTIGQTTSTVHSSSYSEYADASHNSWVPKGPGVDVASNSWALNCGNLVAYSNTLPAGTSSTDYTYPGMHSNFIYGEHARASQAPDNSWILRGGNTDVPAGSWDPNSGFVGSYHSTPAMSSSAGYSTSAVHSTGYFGYARNSETPYNCWVPEGETNPVSMDAWAQNCQNFGASQSASVITSSAWNTTSSSHNFSYGEHARGTVVPDSSLVPMGGNADMSSNAFGVANESSVHSAAVGTSAPHGSNYSDCGKGTDVPGDSWATESANNPNFCTLDGGVSTDFYSTAVTSATGHSISSYNYNFGEHARSDKPADSWASKIASTDVSAKSWPVNMGIMGGLSQSAAAVTSYAETSSTVRGTSFPSPEIGNKIFIARLPVNATAEHLRTYFSSFGRILDVYIPKDATKTGHRGFGFVTFFDEGVAERVALESHEILGQPIAVDRPTPQDCGNKTQFVNPVSTRSGTPAGSEEESTAMTGKLYGTLQNNVSQSMWGSQAGTGVGPLNSSGSRMDFRYRPY